MMHEQSQTSPPSSQPFECNKQNHKYSNKLHSENDLKTNHGTNQNKTITYHVCNTCQKSLPRSSFSKKTFLKNIIQCQTCRKAQTAERCHQPPPKYKTTHARKAPSGVIRRPNNFGYCTYIDKLFSLSCCADIVRLGVFNSAKDISESMAVLGGAFRHGKIPCHQTTAHDHNEDTETLSNTSATAATANPPDVLCLCIGDGKTPQTAVLASFLKNSWMCISIDPALREEWSGMEPKGVRNLFGFKGTLEEFVSAFAENSDGIAGESCESKVDSGMILKFGTNSFHTDRERKGGKNETPALSQQQQNQFSKAVTASTSMKIVDEIRHRSFQHLVLLCVHSHARFRNSCSVPNIRHLFRANATATLTNHGHADTLSKSASTSSSAATSTITCPPTTLVSLPCCTRFRHVGDIGEEPHVKYEDDCVFSDCRTVEIWNFQGGAVYSSGAIMCIDVNDKELFCRELD